MRARNSVSGVENLTGFEVRPLKRAMEIGKLRGMPLTWLWLPPIERNMQRPNLKYGSSKGRA